MAVAGTEINISPQDLNEKYVEGTDMQGAFSDPEQESYSGRTDKKVLQLTKEADQINNLLIGSMNLI